MLSVPQVRAAVAKIVDILPSRLTIPLYYRWRTGRWPASAPRTFSEKMQASKLRPVTPDMVRLADKVAVKEIVAERLGEDWVVPTLFVGPQLPPLAERTWPAPFVIKASHGSGWNVFVRDPPDWPRIERRLRGWLREKRYRFRGELHYRQIVPQLIVEPLLGGSEAPNDYKIFVFGGTARFVQVDRSRFTGHLRAFYDRDWNRLQISRLYPADPQTIPAPPSLPRMLAAAESMAAGFDFLRIDFYDIDGHPYFGEATFFPGSGAEFFNPPEYEWIIGDMWPWPGTDVAP